MIFLHLMIDSQSFSISNFKKRDGIAEKSFIGYNWQLLVTREWFKINLSALDAGGSQMFIAHTTVPQWFRCFSRCLIDFTLHDQTSCSSFPAKPRSVKLTTITLKLFLYLCLSLYFVVCKWGMSLKHKLMKSYSLMWKSGSWHGGSAREGGLPDRKSCWARVPGPTSCHCSGGST